MARRRSKKAPFQVATLPMHPTVLKAIQEARTEETPTIEEIPSKPGILYFKTVPRNMPLQIIKAQFRKFGQLGRAFFIPESRRSYEARHKGKSAGPLRFAEGWLEFDNRKEARKAVKLLHMTPVGGKKNTAWENDRWNVEYLKSVDWEDLMSTRSRDREERTRTFTEEVKRAQDDLIMN